MTEALEVEQYLLPHEYVALRSQFFPSHDAFVWFVRHNRDDLAKAGALIKPTGRLLVHAQKFDAVVLAVGARRAQVA